MLHLRQRHVSGAGHLRVRFLRQISCVGLLAQRRLESEVAASLVPAERALVDAKLAEAVATGRLSEAGAAELTAREAARRAVLDYAAAQAKLVEAVMQLRTLEK